MKLVTSLSKYLSAIEEKLKHFDNSTGPAWFRGEKDCRYRLMPNIYRKFDKENYFERELTRDFKLLSRQFLKDNLPQNNLEWMFVMQHFGLPTRLLDWSESSLIALFFSVHHFQDTCDASVWVFDPWDFNLNITKIGTVPASSNPLFQNGYLLNSDERKWFPTSKKPIAIRPVKNSIRILAQKGTFTLHGKETKSIDQLVSEHNKKEKEKKIYLERITIDGKCKLKIMRELYFSGISYSVIFPEIDKVSEELRFRYSDEFMDGYR